MSIVIRQIEDRDFDGFYAVLGTVARERRYLAFIEPPPVDGARAFVRNNIEKGYPQLVAIADGAVAGWCDVTPAGREVMAHVGVLGMGLAPEFRGKGLGEQLLREAIAAAHRFGFTRIELGVYAHNTRAYALYRKVGFIEEGVRRGRILIDGKHIDEVVMALGRGNAPSTVVTNASIRRIRADDAESFRAAVDVVARERRWLYLTEAPPIERMRELVSANIAKGHPHFVLVAEDGAAAQSVVGWCTVTPLGRAVQAHVGGVAMGVLPAWRDKGWGTRLMQAALAAADAFGFTRVELTVYTHNPRAAALYRKLGFVEEGIKRGSARVDGVYFDEMMMARHSVGQAEAPVSPR